MGLCVFPYIETIISERKKVCDAYDSLLFANETNLSRPIIPENTTYNYAYYPILFKDEQQLLAVKNALAENEIFARRYFYPSLNNLNYIDQKFEVPVSENAAQRALCLPLYVGLEIENVEKIAAIILQIINKC